MYLNKHISWSQELQKYLSYEAHFYVKTLEISFWFQKSKKNAGKNLRFFS